VLPETGGYRPESGNWQLTVYVHDKTLEEGLFARKEVTPNLIATAYTHFELENSCARFPRSSPHVALSSVGSIPPSALKSTAPRKAAQAKRPQFILFE